MTATEHELHLAASNRILVLEINHVAKRLALAEKIAAMLDQTAGDWAEARQALKNWKELSK